MKDIGSVFILGTDREFSNEVGRVLSRSGILVFTGTDAEYRLLNFKSNGSILIIGDGDSCIDRETLSLAQINHPDAEYLIVKQQFDHKEIQEYLKQKIYTFYNKPFDSYVFECLGKTMRFASVGENMEREFRFSPPLHYTDLPLVH